MVRRIPTEVGEKLAEQGKAVGKGLKQAPKTIFQRTVGEKTDEEKKEDKERREKEEKGIEDVTAGQQPLSQTDLRRKQLEAEKKAKLERMKKLLHKRVFSEAEKVRKRKEEEERLRRMQEEEEKKKKQEKKTQEFEKKEKEEALAVKVAKRAKGAGEYGPRKPK